MVLKSKDPKNLSTLQSHWNPGQEGKESLPLLSWHWRESVLSALTLALSRPTGEGSCREPC